MLRGRFGNTSGRPYIEGRLYIPSLAVEGDVSFLLDTGADSTYLTEDDAAVLRVDHGALTEQRESFGVGGKSIDHVVDAFVAFDDRINLYVYDLKLTVTSPNGSTTGLPSLLGRDVLDFWDIRYCHPDARLEAEVLAAYVIRPIAPADLPIDPGSRPDRE